MWRDSVAWGVSVLLFLCGAVFSKAYSGKELLFSEIKDIAELLSYLGTITAAGFAVVAISAWKKQFNHEQRFESLRNLKLMTHKLLIGRNILRSFRARELAKHRSEEEALIQEKNALHREQIASWSKAYAEFLYALEEASLFFKGLELEQLWNAVGEHAKSLNCGINDLSEIIYSHSGKPAMETHLYCQKWENNFDSSIEEINELIRVVRINSIR
ncbi:hypothetical protein [Pseudomonas silesiensis]|uniref:hypothetical protein n=1 Tax=Pseudomonas silesiensis TaxID=1853130 RepID=UPI0034D667AB